jgi:ribosomal protein S18 acetylase RimI-like enzyme
MLNSRNMVSGDVPGSICEQVGAAVLRDLRTSGREACETSSRPGYEGTIAFYRRLHYEVIAQLRDYYSAGDDKFILRKHVSD